jgi:hypothetical protein
MPDTAMKVRERTHEEATEPLHAGRKGHHPEADLLAKEPISKLCDELSLRPTVFYRWQKEFTGLPSGGSLGKRDCCRNGTESRRRRAQALSSHWRRINTGTSTCRTST